MPDDLAGLATLRAELLNLSAIIANPKAPGGTKKRASKAIARVSIEAIDLAMQKLRERQAVDQEDLV